MNKEANPNFIRALWALTLRELKKWAEDPLMVIMIILQPFIWMGFLGKAMNIQGMFSSSNLSNVKLPDLELPGTALNLNVDKVRIPGEIISQAIQKTLSDLGKGIMQSTFGISDYFSFMAIGMISMIVLTTTMFSGMSIVWDRRLGFLDKVLTTPAPRSAIIFSKILNATFRALFQATVILALAYLLGLHISSTFTPFNILIAYAAITLVSFGFSSIFLAFSIRATRMERPMQFVNLITTPLMFASNTFFPITLMPKWLQIIATVNPLTYLTDALRQLIILSLNLSALITDFIVLIIFASIFSLLGIILSWKYLTK